MKRFTIPRSTIAEGVAIAVVVVAVLAADRFEAGKTVMGFARGKLAELSALADRTPGLPIWGPGRILRIDIDGWVRGTAPLAEIASKSPSAAGANRFDAAFGLFEPEPTIEAAIKSRALAMTAPPSAARPRTIAQASEVPIEKPSP